MMTTWRLSNERKARCVSKINSQPPETSHQEWAESVKVALGPHVCIQVAWQSVKNVFLYLYKFTGKS